MRALYLLVLFALCLSVASKLMAMTELKRALSYKEKPRYELLCDSKDKEQITKLLCKRTLRPKRQHELADLCLSHETYCRGQDIFEKIDPNLVMSNGQSFALELLHNNSYVLLREALDHYALDPHLKHPYRINDLAFEILMSGEKELIKILTNHPNFNPNYRYGEAEELLTTRLFLENKMLSLKHVLKHKNYSNKIKNKKNFRLGYYILSDYEKEFKDCFMLFMGADLATWDMRGLGLEESANLNTIFTEILNNNKDRFLVLKKVIESLMIDNEEGNNDNEMTKFMLSSVLKLFFVDNSWDPIIYIDFEFTVKALKMLVNYKVVTEKKVGHIYPFSWWFYGTNDDLESINFASIRSAAKRHVITNEKDACSFCLEVNAGMWFKTSSMCEHTCCMNCWISFFSTKEANEELMCPGRDCTVPVPPSLILALSAHCVHLEGNLSVLTQTHRDHSTLQRKICDETLDAVPNLVRCPKCQRAVIVKKNNSEAVRKIACRGCSETFVLSAGQTNDVLPSSSFTQLGRCQKCLVPLDKIAGCPQITCPVCKKSSVWEAMEVQ